MATPENEDIDEDLEAVIQATRSSRRTDALKLLAGGIGGLAGWVGVIWGLDPSTYDGVDRTFLYVAGFGSLGIGGLLTLFAAALFVNSLVLTADAAEENPS